jgi:error-prone DNA polymerase
MAHPGYVELHCHSYYSLLDGASSPEALVDRAVRIGYPALALTDHNGLYGAVRFWHAAREQGLKPILGSEVHLACAGPAQGEHHLTLLAQSRQGYAHLCQLISAGQLAGQKGQLRLDLDTLARYAEGLLCLSGCRRGRIPQALVAGDEQQARRYAAQLQAIFASRFWIEVQRHYLPGDTRLESLLLALAKDLGLGVVATNNVHYAERGIQPLHDLLASIRQHTTLPQALGGGLLHPNSEQFLKSSGEMASLFAHLPEALENSQHIAERCNVDLDFAGQRLPDFAVPEGHTPSSYLDHLCREGLRHKFDPPYPRAQAQLAHELAVIEGAGLAGYFLVVWDIVRFARQRGIRCQGRGSAANSLVAYLLDITPVDPLRHNLLFERFLSEGTQTMPDIDIDFAADRREEVIHYVYERYGEKHVGMVCNVVTYRARSALRDAAQALAFPADVIDRAAKALDTHSTTQAAAQLPSHESDSRRPLDLPWQILTGLLKQMEGVPRHLSIHVGGMLITAAPLSEVVPLERATMPGRVVVQWDKESVEDAGLIKIDLLGLRTLSVVEEALAHIRSGRGVAPAWDHLPLDDPQVYELLRRADTVGCFQVESRAQAQMQPKLLAQCFEDLVISIALIRPGPIQGGMVHPYLRRRQGLEPVDYLHPALEPVLAETLGVIVFQEQVLRVAMAMARFPPAEADRLRRAMSRSRSEAAMAALHERFLAGAVAQGVEGASAERVWQQLAGFAGFGFCKSHAAAFALVAYQTLYLKAHFPAEFYCALLNHQPLGFYPPGVIMGDAQRHGIPVLRPEINTSQVACNLERADPPAAIRLGLRYLHGLGEAWQARIVERRGERPFADLADFCQRTRLPRPVVENLIRAGAMDSLPGLSGPGAESLCPQGGSADPDRNRRDLLWALGSLSYQEEGLNIEVPIEPVTLPDLDYAERLAWEYELLGMAPGDHVMNLYRGSLRAQGVLTSREIQARRDGETVRVAGLGVVRQRPPTAKGHLFITLEDEEGLINLIVRPQVYDQYRDTLRNTPLLWVEGRLQREGEAVSVLVHRASAILPKSRRPA